MPKNMPGRNDPCPCGSGKKYKHCHLGKPLPGFDGAPKQSSMLPLILVVLCIAAGVAVGLKSGLETGFAVGGGSLMLVGIYLVIRKPPPPNANSGDPAGLNFGN